MVKKTQYEVKVPTMDTISIEGTIIDTYDYPLTHDKVRRYIVPSQRIVKLKNKDLQGGILK